LLTDDLPLQLLELARNARLGKPAQKTTWRQLQNCLLCLSRTWPMGHNAAGQHLEQCLHCGQRYVVLGKRPADKG
jgi:hypothetical protein